MNDDRLFYKVVVRYRRQLRSLIVFLSPTQVIYSPGKVARSEYGPLMIFREIERAWRFARVNSFDMAIPDGVEVWSCKAENPRRNNRVLNGTDARRSIAVKSYWAWRSEAGEQTRVEETAAPGGTWIADSVILVERVEEAQ